jgi:hypothetical protein
MAPMAMHAMTQITGTHGDDLLVSYTCGLVYGPNASVTERGALPVQLLLRREYQELFMLPPAEVPRPRRVPTASA